MRGDKTVTEEEVASSSWPLHTSAANHHKIDSGETPLGRPAKAILEYAKTNDTSTKSISPHCSLEKLRR